MNTYEVFIKATITKSVVVDAFNAEEAEKEAHLMLSSEFFCNNYQYEKYEQKTIGETQLVK